MAISNLFTIGTSAITAQRLAMEVTSENIANVNTPGYSRQRAILRSEDTSLTNGFPLGTGVSIAAVQRSYDRLLQRQFIDGSGSYHQSLAEQHALQQIEPVLNEVSFDGLGKAIDDFFNSWQDLSVNPQGKAERQEVMIRANVMTDMFHQVNTSLSNVITNTNAALVTVSADINDKAENVALLNRQIVEAETSGDPANELRDQRDFLVRQLAEQAGISYSENSDGTVDIRLGNADLVQRFSNAAVYPFPPAPANSSIYITPLGNPPAVASPAGTAPDLLIYQAGAAANPLSSLGELGGMLRARDIIIPGYRDQLDELANQVVSEVNAQHQMGYALDGTTGNNFFDPGTTGSIDIKLDAALTTTKIAAGQPTASDPVPTSSGNNVNALAMAGLKNKTSIAFSSGQSTFDNFYTGMVSDIGIKLQGANNKVKFGESFLRQLDQLRESQSGVSLDEELTNLIKYQRAFEGAARLVTTADQMMQTLLGMVR